MFFSVEILTAMVYVVTIVAILHILVLVIVHFLLIIYLIKNLELVFILKFGNHPQNLLILKNLNQTTVSLSRLLCSTMLRSTLVLSLCCETLVPTFQCKLIHYLIDLGRTQTRTKWSHFELGWIMVDRVDLWSFFVSLNNESKVKNVKAYPKPFVNISIINFTITKNRRKTYDMHPFSITCS